MSSDDEYVDDDLFGEAEAGPSHFAAQHLPPSRGSSRGSRSSRGRGRGVFPTGGPLDDIPAPTGFNALGGMFPGFGGIGRGLGGGLGGMLGGMRPAASTFKKNYRAFSTALLEAQQGRGERSNVMHGGKIIMPQEALMELTDMEMESPYMFEVRNLDPDKRDLFTHCGVLEFIAAPETVHLPQWMMRQLGLQEGDPIRLMGVRLPKGQFMTVQAQDTLYLELEDPRHVMEQALKNYTCLTKGDTIEIHHNMMTFEFLIEHLEPADAPGVNVIDTDLKVDFSKPKGYIEPTPVPRAPPATMASKKKINTSGTQSVDARGSGTSTPTQNPSASANPSDPSSSNTTGGAFEAFRGGGKTMGGKVVKGKGVGKKKIEEVDPESKIIRTGGQRIVTADTQIGERKVPAKLELPYGTLFFGYNVQPFRQHDPNAPAPATEPAGPFTAVTGEGNTLSGRTRPRPTADSFTPAPGSLAPAAATSPAPFGGVGHSLTGGPSASGSGMRLGGTSKGPRRPGDVIEID